MLDIATALGTVGLYIRNNNMTAAQATADKVGSCCAHMDPPGTMLGSMLSHSAWRDCPLVPCACRWPVTTQVPT
jgi:hypothetical protein